MEFTVKEGKVSIVWFVFHLLIDFLAIFILIGIWWGIKHIIEFLTVKLTITNKRVKGHTGLINTTDLDSPLNKIEGVMVKQSLLGKIFNYGTVIITTASTSFTFDSIDKPNVFKATLNNQIEIYENEKLKRQAKEMADAIQ